MTSRTNQANGDHRYLFLLAVAVVLIIILAVKPKKPQFDLQQVAVQYLLVASSASATGVAGTIASPPAAYLSLNITMLFTAENPNKVGIRYGEMQFMVMYRGVPLGLATVPGIEQPAHSTRLVQTRVSVNRFNILRHPPSSSFATPPSTTTSSSASPSMTASSL